MVSLHHGSPGKVHKFAGTTFLQVLKSIKVHKTYHNIIATYKFPGDMPSTISCFKALLKKTAGIAKCFLIRFHKKFVAFIIQHFFNSDTSPSMPSFNPLGSCISPGIISGRLQYLSRQIIFIIILEGIMFDHATISVRQN